LFTFVHVFDQIIYHFYFEFKIVFGLIILQFFETFTCIDLMRQMVNITNLCWFNLEFIILAFAYNNRLYIMFNIILIIVWKLFFKTVLLVINNFMLMVDLILFIHPLIFIMWHYQMFKVIAIHLRLEPIFLSFFIFLYLDLIISLWRIFINTCIVR